MLISKLKIAGAAGLACALALGGVPTLARQFGATGQRQALAGGATLQAGAADGAQRPAESAPATGDQQAELLRRVAKIDDELDLLARNHRQLQTDLRALREQLQALQSSTSPSAGKSQEPAQPASRPPFMATSVEKVQPAQSPQARGKDVRNVDRRRGGSSAADRPHYFPVAGNIVMTSPKGDKVAVYNIGTGKSKSLTLPAINGELREVAPTFTNMPSGQWFMARDVVAGSKMTRLIAFDIFNGTYYQVDLPEPVDRARQLPWGANISGGVLVLGHRVYAFSPYAKRWGVLTLPDKPDSNKPVLLSTNNPNNQPQVEHDGRLYLFNATTGDWEDIYAKAIGDDPKANSTAEPQGVS